MRRMVCAVGGNDVGRGTCRRRGDGCRGQWGLLIRQRTASWPVGCFVALEVQLMLGVMFWSGGCSGSATCDVLLLLRVMFCSCPGCCFAPYAVVDLPRALLCIRCCAVSAPADFPLVLPLLCCCCSCPFSLPAPSALPIRVYPPLHLLYRTSPSSPPLALSD